MTPDQLNILSAMRAVLDPRQRDETESMDALDLAMRSAMPALIHRTIRILQRRERAGTYWTDGNRQRMIQRVAIDANGPTRTSPVLIHNAVVEQERPELCFKRLRQFATFNTDIPYSVAVIHAFSGDPAGVRPRAEHLFWPPALRALYADDADAEEVVVGVADALHVHRRSPCHSVSDPFRLAPNNGLQGWAALLVVPHRQAANPPETSVVDAEEDEVAEDEEIPYSGE